MDIVIVGSGNIATHFATSFNGQGHNILQVYSRNLANAQALAKLFAVPATNQINDIDVLADLYVIAVSDNAIPEVISQLPKSIQGILVHTAGATPMNTLVKFKQYGVIYPVQSITKGMPSNLSEIPFGVEGSDARVSSTLTALMTALSKQTFSCDSTQRLALHTAAVFANNFSNALFQIAYDILQTHDLSFDLLKPIIEETAKKIQDHLPSQTQTGPAQRNDIQTIRRHLQFLSRNPSWVKIYQQLTEEISSNRNI
ncbi:MAG: Rossmann-like and DUF2520 domain-containing protein [Sphingobacterium sp.]